MRAWCRKLPSAIVGLMLFALGFLVLALAFLAWGARAVWLAVSTQDPANNPKRGVLGALSVVAGLLFAVLAVLAALVALGVHAAGGLMGWYTSTQADWH